jgi:hypothetical protein
MSSLPSLLTRKDYPATDCISSRMEEESLGGITGW